VNLFLSIAASRSIEASLVLKINGIGTMYVDIDQQITEDSPSYIRQAN